MKTIKLARITFKGEAIIPIGNLGDDKIEIIKEHKEDFTNAFKKDLMENMPSLTVEDVELEIINAEEKKNEA